MVNPVTMQFSSAKGNFIFPKDEMPLLGRKIEYMRQADQGHSNRKINCDMNGFFDRRNHADIMAAYKSLIEIIKCNDAEFVYTTTDSLGVTADIIRKRVYIDSYTDPAEWKEYQGEYSINFHYFEQPDFAIADLGIAASYQTAAGLYTFAIPPNWQHSLKPSRSSFRASRFTPAGGVLSSEATITLTGTITGNSHSEMKTKIDELRDAFKLDGTLNYGAWSNAVRVDSVDIPQTFPRDYCNFSLSLKYDLTNIYAFKSTRSFSRIHGFPKIKEYPYCGTRRVQTFYPSAQTVRYSIHIQSSSIASCRSLLANEAFILITPGGIEMEGGTEDWDDTDLSVTLNCTKFYDPPLLGNLPNT